MPIVAKKSWKQDGAKGQDFDRVSDEWRKNRLDGKRPTTDRVKPENGVAAKVSLLRMKLGLKAKQEPATTGSVDS